MTTIYLIRHAEAEGNVYRRCHGIYDSLLTPKAYEQLPYLAERFADVPLDAVYASPLYRARHTAKAIADRKGMQVIIRPALHEIDMGDWEDRTWAILPREYPEAYAVWRTRPWECTVPGGESVLGTGDRVLHELHQIAAERPNQTLAVVSHGSAIRSILCRVLHLAPEQITDIGWGDNTCVAKLLFMEDGSVRAEYWNDASHLPQELSTFASIGWSDNKGIPSTVQVWFRPYDPKSAEDRALLLQFVHEQYRSAYGTDALLDEAAKLAQADAASAVLRRAVSFGMLEDKAIALVFLDAANRSRPNVGMVGCYCISSEYRGHGLSQQILGQSISVYRELGCEYLCAGVAEHNERAKGFYHKYHFAQNGELINECGRHFLMYKPIQVPALHEESTLFDLREMK
ncbi:MAG: GNAT family N-acetyltransferase [Clostridiaceae bacterium]|nr:GNAT family N-acetyltransferase [Clostridiaceae bacterium]